MKKSSMFCACLLTAILMFVPSHAKQENLSEKNTNIFSTCDVTAWDPNKAYNVYNEEPGVEVSYNGKIYKLIQGTWAPVGTSPETWATLWEFVRNCGESGGGDDGGDTGGNDDYTRVACLRKHLIIGYWHNFNNGTANGLKLTQVNEAYDFLNVSFGETDASDRAVITFYLDNSIYANDAAFIADIRTMQAKGKKINLSLGGQNGIIHVNSESDKTKFVNSVIGIIDKYGFDGLDIDFEGTSAGTAANSFITPSANAQFMIDGIREICNHYGDNFILTMAPETAYVQFGIGQGTAPAYMALIYGLRDKLTVLHVQLYNTGSSNDLYGNNAIPGTAGYLVAMTEMLLQGFPNCGTTFPALREDQVAIGIPACVGAGGNAVSMTEAKKAMQYLITGTKPADISYVLKKPSGYPNLRGVMTWSVNWDSSNGYDLANTFNSYFEQIGNPWEGCETVDVEPVKNKPFAIYPNPVTDILNIETTANATYCLYDLTGKILYAGKLTTGNNILSMKNYTHGLYIIKVEDGLNVNTSLIRKQ